MKRAYPTFIVESEKDFLVFVPDMELYTEGKSLEDAIEMARDAIGLKGIDFEDDGKDIPLASDYEKALQKARDDADSFDFSKGILTLVNIDFDEYRRRVDNKSVRRNVTIPNWLNREAERENLNVSGVLQEALMTRLGMQRRV